MSSTPLITVIIPCFDDDATLAMALASLLAQTVDNWECIIVDDGSGESIEPVVERFDDRRFKLIAFDDNQGRSVARQVALDEARGEFICFLDADDWCFPQKLERQLAKMEGYRGLAAVGAGMSVIDNAGNLIGIRRFSPTTFQVFVGNQHHPPRIHFPTVMIRREQALAHQFDPRLERSEDHDYLGRVLAGHHYGVSPAVLYAYRETFSDKSMGEALIGFRNERKIFRKRFNDIPLQMVRPYLWNLMKSSVYGVARTFGCGRWLFERRNRPATCGERREFERSRRVVWQKLNMV